MPRTDTDTRKELTDPTTVPVLEPIDLCALQRATRELCRSIAFSEAEVFEAVTGVSELAHGLLVAASRPGEVVLRGIPTHDGIVLGVQVLFADRGPVPPSPADSATYHSGMPVPWTRPI